MINPKENLNIISNRFLQLETYFDLAELKNKKILISGGTGFFGLWILSLINFLNGRNAQIFVWVISRNPENFLKKFPHFRKLEWLKFVTADIENIKFTNQSLDYVIHAATDTSMNAHAKHLKMLDNIILGTRKILEVAENSKASKVLLVSSGAIYGTQPYRVPKIKENHRLSCDVLNPVSAYAEGKRVMELLGSIFADQTGISVTVARCFTFMGPGIELNSHFAFGNFIRDALFSEEIKIEGDGRPVRSYLHGSDLAIWLLTLVIKGENNNAYNVGSNNEISIKNLAEKIKTVLAPQCSIIYKKTSPSSILGLNRYVPCTLKMQDLGCKDWTSLEQGIKDTAMFNSELSAAHIPKSAPIN